MDNVYFGIIIFLFLLAIFDLVVGVSNDAVNFLNSAIGAKVAKFRTIITIAALGVIIGATMSNGMMDIARHGIFQPQMFSFKELMCVFLAVMVTDVFLLDIFNNLGMPTSTTVSMVFELLGGAFVISIIKIHSDPSLSLGNLLNAEKALSVIISIFVSVAIAFFFGCIVQWLSRLAFTFNYIKRQKYFIAIFGGIATTAIAYFIFIKGLKSSPWIGDELKKWITDNTTMLIGMAFIVLTVLMEILHLLKVNIFKLIVLLGTFALAMAFAGNDLVNFIGVPLAGFSSYQDYVANGNGDLNFLMGSLNESAKTPFVFLFIAGIVMIISLVTSKKAQNVVKTSVDLSRQDEGEEMFGSSRMARYIVRFSYTLNETIEKIVPEKVKNYIDSRFQKEDAIISEGGAFDLVRASVNLVLASLLIIMGTSLKLPLSTTYVTFMVAMGTSLADRAWSRESAVFRITGVLSVIGGWFITAGVAFFLCAVVTMIMLYTGTIGMMIMIALVILLLIRSNINFRKKSIDNHENDLFKQMMKTKNKDEVWTLLNKHLDQSQSQVLNFTLEKYASIITNFENEDRKALKLIRRELSSEKESLKKRNRQELLGMRKLDKTVAIEFNTWYYLGTNSALQLVYGLIRMCEPCYEHIDNNFNPLPDDVKTELEQIKTRITNLLNRTKEVVDSENFEDMPNIRQEAEMLQDELSAKRKTQYDKMQDYEPEKLRISMVYLNILQESQELLSSLRHLVRANSKFQTLR